MLLQIVYFYQSNSYCVIYATYDGGVVTCWQVCYDRRLPSVHWSVAAVPNIGDLIVGDNPADYRGPPVIVRRNQSSVNIVEFQCGLAIALETP